MNIYLQETTEWNEPYIVHNNIYILNPAGHLVGYIKSGTEEEIIFSSPMKTFSKSRRKFTKIKKKKVA
tara:strand:- start:4429 stop:4632 length:204 start_codon:yes stop_codon:yes gene_type:complete